MRTLIVIGYRDEGDVVEKVDLLAGDAVPVISYKLSVIRLSNLECGFWIGIRYLL